MRVKVLFWIFSLFGLAIGLTLGMRGDLLGLVGLIASNTLVFTAFAMSVISRARESASKPQPEETKPENSLAPSLAEPLRKQARK